MGNVEETVYVASDELDPEWWSQLRSALKAAGHGVGGGEKFSGLVEMIICTAARSFWGSRQSTFTAGIQSLRKTLRESSGPWSVSEEEFGVTNKFAFLQFPTRAKPGVATRRWSIEAPSTDKFMDSCMAQLGVVRTNQYRLLSETACGEHPAPCGSADVAFHPFKSIQSYFSCWGFADKYGHGPADPRGSWEDGDGRMGVYYLSRDQELKG
ncbi:unnamed protein product [Prorocentrum cordatum]|uniref:Poly(ADP-ribose) glycohydrolase n=1 Tax=Prorocentrum cordatum TaxID=2364126 RepID=A0ABN9PQJ9_9DINO|nr:unnamed protein product [Polarella glacialis]